MAPCSPLLRGGGVRGGSGTTMFDQLIIVMTVFFSTTPNPSFQKEGTTLGVCYPLFGQTVLLPSFRRGWGRWSAPTFGCRLRWMLFYVFASRRGDFAEMMDVRREARGACSPELTSSQTSRHTVPTASAGVFPVFFNIFRQFRVFRCLRNP